MKPELLDTIIEINDKIRNTIFWCKFMDTFNGLIFVGCFAFGSVALLLILDKLGMIDMEKWFK